MQARAPAECRKDPHNGPMGCGLSAPGVNEDTYDKVFLASASGAGDVTCTRTLHEHVKVRGFSHAGVSGIYTKPRKCRS